MNSNFLTSENDEKSLQSKLFYFLKNEKYYKILFLLVKYLKGLLQDYERKEEGKLNKINTLEEELFLKKVNLSDKDFHV
jgi:hypothetical protein